MVARASYLDRGTVLICKDTRKIAVHATANFRVRQEGETVFGGENEVNQDI
jgi:hypothetical protein